MLCDVRILCNYIVQSLFFTFQCDSQSSSIVPLQARNEIAVPHEEMASVKLDNQLTTSGTGIYTMFVHSISNTMCPHVGHISSEPHPLQKAIETQLINTTNKIEDTSTIVDEHYLMEPTVAVSYEQVEDSCESEDFYTPPSSPLLDPQTALHEASTAAAAEGMGQFHPAVDSENLTITG